MNQPTGLFCAVFGCSPRVCVGSLWVPWLPPTVRRHAFSRFRLIADFKLAIAVAVNGGLSLYVSHSTD